MNYTYKDLVDDLSLGHEVEFSYRGEKYSISRNENGWFLTKYNDIDTVQKYNDSEEVLEKGILDSKNIRLIWSEVTEISVL
ncbi:MULTISPECIES: hypothetical protein [unclassified Psychrobacillus]|uniref:hypothetical protein n=1 Tax=unclassified Psychrobacillus TaxID=2636677 RepID=UPI00146C6EDB|nr:MULTISPECIES: hypothetical protein [unclassified Psychrobacillus]MCM3360233.1 hypothetical protein [Psychrobacillus sp. MER TA 171]NME07217.1 hypothetical protein [Psychrobacillus sp. BL-248-WT-3]